MQIPAKLLSILKVAGVEEIGVEFEGSGDSGSVGDVLFWRANELFVPDIDYDMVLSRDEWDGEQRGWVKAGTVKTMPIKEVMTQITYELLEQTDQDWYNNDGGYGQLIIKLNTSPPEMKLDMHIRHVETDDYEFEIEVGKLEEE